jgi:hypothetical protein
VKNLCISIRPVVLGVGYMPISGELESWVTIFPAYITCGGRKLPEVKN